MQGRIPITIEAKGGAEAAREILTPAEAMTGLRAAATDAEAGLGGLKDAAAEAGQELPELMELDVIIEELRKLRGAADAASGAGAAGGGMDLRGLRGIGSVVGRLVPQLGPLGRAISMLAGGPMGLVAAAAGLAAQKVFELKGSLDEWEAANQKQIEEWDKTVEAILEHRRLAAAAAEEEKARTRRAYEFAEALRQAGAGQFYMNEVLADEIRLLKERQGMEREMAAAEDALAMEEAAGDPLRQAQVREQNRIAGREREMRNLREQLAAQQKRLDQLAFEERERREIGAGTREGAEAGVTMAQADVKRLEEEAREAQGTDAEKGLVEDLAEARRLLVEKQRELSEAEVETRRVTEGLNKEMNDIFREMQDLARRLQVMESNAPLEDRAGDIRVGRAREEAQRKQREADDKARRERLGERAGEVEGRLNDEATAAAGEFGARARDPRLRNANVAAMLEKTAAALADGTNARELAKVSQQFEAATAGMQSSVLDSMRLMLRKQQDLAQELETLRRQVRNRL